ncbi:MAG: phenylalanine--tRNA ligase subunit beta [Deltaproteobacteria bacterium]|nr:phenylalanine--tRNA ligase subunit beta [Deltaproteobacteria bacterium]
MKASLSWLKKYITIDMELSELADALTMAGLEVDNIYDRYEYLDKVVVGCITEIKPHPNADRLSLCTITTGDDQINLVCGADNIKTGMHVPLALPGAELPGGFVIKKSVIRGEASGGILCSATELGLGEDKKGIMNLPDNLKLGESLAIALKLSDPVLEIDLTPNRPDCLGIIGVAREIAAFQNKQVQYPSSKPIASAELDENISDLTSVKIENTDLCSRYGAKLFKNVKIGHSPLWLKDRLISTGIRPINNFVDITNYVMMETGQPLHAFDFDKLAEKRIVVRTAKKGENFITLDNKKRTLSKQMLMICDGEKPVAIAGVMGGLNSEVTDTTTSVLLESAYFDPSSIRKTSKKFSLNTDAAHRFERGVDPAGTIKALKRAVQLIEKTKCGTVINGIIDENPVPYKPLSINVKLEEINSLLGTNIKRNKIIELLQGIEFSVKNKTKDEFDNLFIITPPSYRVDIKRPVDIIEEIARLYGYNRIPVTFPAIPAKTKKSSSYIVYKKQIKSLMTGLGFSECINYSFINNRSAARLNLEPDDARYNMVNLLNPLSKDHAVMRSSLIPGMLETMRRNITRNVYNLKLFEIGKIFIHKGEDVLPREKEIIAGLLTGTREESNWHNQDNPVDFYDLKGAVEALFDALKINKTASVKFTMLPDNQCYYTKPGYTAQIISGNKTAGIIGEVNHRVLNNFNLSAKAFIFEINLTELYKLIPETVFAEPVPKFPAVSRDITMIVDKNFESANILENESLLKENLLEKLELLAVFEGEPIPTDKKSISFRITYRSAQGTLEDNTINKIHKKLSDNLITEFNAALPE